VVKAFVALKTGGSEYLSAGRTIKEKLVKIPGVLRVEIIFGRYDIIAEVEAKDIKELSHLISDQIKCIPNVASTETFICYS
jgi:DNA-binding Lrp family transcriptional regulator